MPQRCDLEQCVAQDLLRDHVQLATASPQTLWVYGRVMHSSADWASIWPWRHFLSELLDVSEGKLLRQKCWEMQVQAFLELHVPGRFSAQQVVVAAYAVRKMLSHLWWAKKHGKSPTGRWERLQVLVSKVSCGVDYGSSVSESPGKCEAVSSESEHIQVVVPSP